MNLQSGKRDIGDFTDMDENLGTATPDAAKYVAPQYLSESAPEVAMIEERCPKCRNGTFYAYTGRALGPGKLYFKNSRETRAKGRAAKVRQTDNRNAQVLAEFAEKNPAEWNWIESNRASFEFAASLHAALVRFGALTAPQLAAIGKCIAKRAEAQAAAVERRETAPVVDISPLVSAFSTARGKGIKNPAMLLDVFKFKAAPMTGKNPGAIYITESGEYLGKIADGKLFVVGSCSEDAKARIIGVCARPLEAALAYGQRTGVCSCCGRGLTNGISVELGIGPICREKFGL